MEENVPIESTFSSNSVENLPDSEAAPINSNMEICNLPMATSNYTGVEGERSELESNHRRSDYQISKLVCFAVWAIFDQFGHFGQDLKWVATHLVVKIIHFYFILCLYIT